MPSYNGYKSRRRDYRVIKLLFKNSGLVTNNYSISLNNYTVLSGFKYSVVLLYLKEPDNKVV